MQLFPYGFTKIFFLNILLLWHILSELSWRRKKIVLRQYMTNGILFRPTLRRIINSRKGVVSFQRSFFWRSIFSILISRVFYQRGIFYSSSSRKREVLFSRGAYWNWIEQHAYTFMLIYNKCLSFISWEGNLSFIYYFPS